MGQDPRSHMQTTNPTIIPQMYRVEFLGAYCHLSSGRRVGIMNSTPSSLKSHGRISLSSSSPGSSTLHIQPQLTWSLSFPLPICQAHAYVRAYLQMHRNSHFSLNPIHFSHSQLYLLKKCPNIPTDLEASPGQRLVSAFFAGLTLAKCHLCKGYPGLLSMH